MSRSPQLSLTSHGPAIMIGHPHREYHPVGEVRARVRSRTVLSRAPTSADLNRALQQRALEIGASAVIGVRYSSSISLGARPTLSARGIGVVLL